jgi:hypothetical protein
MPKPSGEQPTSNSSKIATDERDWRRMGGDLGMNNGFDRNGDLQAASASDVGTL